MIFEPYSNRTLALANRIAMAPMTRCRADHRDAVPNDMMVEYYRQRAGAGLIISEGVPQSLSIQEIRSVAAEFSPSASPSSPIPTWSSA